MMNSQLSGPPDHRYNVLLVENGGQHAGRERLLGALQHAHAQGWRLWSTAIQDANTALDLHGVLGEFLFEENARFGKFHLSDLGIPVVSCAEPTPHPGRPQVVIDYVAVGELAARHLRATGFQRYAFLGVTEQRSTDDQLTGFLRLLNRANLRCRTQLVARDISAELSTQRLEWARSLRSQTAVHCASDELALHVSLACQTLGRPIPDDIAVLGVGNDPWLCAFPEVALSSVAIPYRAVGQKSAALLSRLMSGERVTQATESLPPGEVVVRASTQSYAQAPGPARRALRFMREHAYRGISVQDVLEHAKLSRRSLEQYVRAVLGHAPHQELTRLRVERAAYLLEHGTAPLQEVARAAGFSDGRQMSETFRRHLAQTPSQYRRFHRRPQRSE